MWFFETAATWFIEWSCSQKGDWGMQNCSSVRNPGVLYKVPGATPLAGENVSKSQAPMGPSSPQGQILGNQPAKFGKSLWTLAIATSNGSNFGSWVNSGHPGWKGSHMRPKSRVDHDVQWFLLLLKQTIWVMSVLYSYIPFLDSPVQSHSSKRVNCWWFRWNCGWFLLGLHFPPYSGSSCRLSRWKYQRTNYLPIAGWQQNHNNYSTTRNEGMGSLNLVKLSLEVSHV